MIIKTLNRSESQIAMKDWLFKYPKLPEINNEYMKIRLDVQSFNTKVKNECHNESSKKDYYYDIHLGILLYNYLMDKPGFSLRAAANDDFWRYMSLKVIPNIVAERWGKDNESHYWSKSARIWLRSIWWYIHLSWQGDTVHTMHVLESPCFSTDSILNMEERTGRKGTFINVYRYIMYFYSRIPQADLKKFNKNKKSQQGDLFRVIMKLNTAKVMVIDPALYLGGEKEYVRSLFSDVGVRV